ncbi:Short-chain dehydrogenase [Candidatus Methylobacter favarea]|uniref:Short-chain dehydrogenase n=1 Tax=Candidatus Methylobacter favarea TaxID=2707345 RepID=A0A8S0X869_9GAMM|nr:SDR family NAD(P)-dependent oxidoreductase [Candidatus Methylobacter favarea]CAA9890800.1 Short-chain dehydrogenase [Candidatus Methylobacter favarea]
MTDNKKKIVIAGATSAIAEHCARLWVSEAAVDLTLIGRNSDRTERVAADLRVRSPQSVFRILEADFIDPLAIRQLVDGIVAEGSVDIVLIAHGSLPDQAVCQQDLTACHEALTVNGISPVLFAEAFAGHMQKANRGTLAMIGSVAGDRGRKSNYVYGAAKGLVTRYAQGLQHRLANTGVKVVLIKPGPTDTPMTAHLKQQGARLASVENVAQLIVKGITQGKPVVYVPAKWALIMMVIRHLPRFVFNKLEI